MSSIRVGSAPDSWGVWFPEDPEQTTPERFLAEVAAAGYDVIELGPYGFLPTDPTALADTLREHGLSVSAGTVFEHLHQPESWDHVWDQVADVAALTRAVGGEHLVVIPEPWRDHKTGAPKEPRELDAASWDRLTTGMDTLGRRVLEEYGLRVQFHSHADSHVGYQREIERFVESTDPRYVNLCLDTGHVSYYGGDNVAIIRKYPERIGYLHLKQVDPAIVARVEAEDLPFPDAVRAGAMIEPPHGVPSMPDVLRAVEEAVLPVNPDVFAIVEQDMYPCPADMPLPIAKRTRTYLAGCGGAVAVGPAALTTA
ncbi:sugar phosphate isomerase/epimerase family protein [Actinomycetospora sp. CA-084318]|uniref:sugar phosphate isomerase/epimerase family protein n=1 Tax=Actinomycetospora sp. CA-084318 TaxID=3239892 RepID=UPI003D97CEFB